MFQIVVRSLCIVKDNEVIFRRFELFIWKKPEFGLGHNQVDN
jgi:hypothetical protein